MNADLKPTAAQRFRRYFATGLLVLAPIWATLYLVVLVVRIIGGFLSPLLRQLAESLYEGAAWLAVVRIAADVAAFIITVIFIAIVGYFVRKVIGKKLLDLVGRLLNRIPVIREVYDGVSKFLQMLFGEKAGFKRVVAVQFPNEQSWAIGFVTNSGTWALPNQATGEMLSVFVPTTPNPTSGFLLLCKPEQVTTLDLTIDEAVKLIISGGTLGKS